MLLTLLRPWSSGNGWTLQRQAVMAEAGAFRLDSIPPGEYFLLAWPTGTEFEYLNPDVIEEYRSSGKTVTVREGETTRVAIQPVRSE